MQLLLLDLLLGKPLLVTSHYQRAFDEACEGLNGLLKRRKEIGDQIRTLRRTILALADQLSQDKKREAKLMNILNEIGVFSPRLTDAIKDALYSAYSEVGPRKLPPIQVSTLRRLATQKGIGSEAGKMGEVVYWWSGPHYGARTSLANVLETNRQQAREMQTKIAARVRGRIEEE